MEGNLDNASLNDIIFENRNKAYGAYMLRREYYSNLQKAAALAISGFALLFCFAFAAIKLKPGLVEAPIKKTIKFTLVDIQPKPEVEKQEIKPAVPAATQPVIKVASRAFIEPKIVPSDEPITEDIPEQAAFANADPGEITSTGALPGTVAPLIEEGTGNGAGTGTATSTEPFLVVEEMPSFSQGGEAGMYKYISKHLHYPPRAQEQSLEGNVIISFVVNASGDISDVKVLKDIGGGTAEEAIRVISKMPRWKPGIQNHRPVPVRMTLPIRFKLSS